MPLPEQVGQGSSITLPWPPHSGQGWEIEKTPWLWASIPRPSQRGQTRGAVPGFAPVPEQVGQEPVVGTETATWVPCIAWSKESLTSVSRSSGLRSGCHLRARSRYAFLISSADADLLTPRPS